MLMNARMLWARILTVVGGIAMLLGSVDPLEGSLLILSGSGLIALGTFMGKSQRRVIRYWLWVFGLIAVGVSAMFALSAFGGIGGKSGHSMWWGVLMLPYPVGWLLALAGAVLALVRFVKARRQRARA
jgi:purine-cytosine permease-like protein